MIFKLNFMKGHYLQIQKGFLRKTKFLLKQMKTLNVLNVAKRAILQKNVFQKQPQNHLSNFQEITLFQDPASFNPSCFNLVKDLKKPLKLTLKPNTGRLKPNLPFLNHPQLSHSYLSLQSLLRLRTKGWLLKPLTGMKLKCPLMIMKKFISVP